MPVQFTHLQIDRLWIRPIESIRMFDRGKEHMQSETFQYLKCGKIIVLIVLQSTDRMWSTS